MRISHNIKMAEIWGCIKMIRSEKLYEKFYYFSYNNVMGHDENRQTDAISLLLHIISSSEPKAHR